jgi:hypothetical protein
MQKKHSKSNLKSALKKKEKGKAPPSFSAFRPEWPSSSSRQPALAPPPSPAPGRPAQCPPWAELAAGPARAHEQPLPLTSLSLADIAGLHAEATFLHKSTPTSLSLFSTAKSRVSNLHLPYLEPLQGYISRVSRTAAPIHPFRSVSRTPEMPPRAQNPTSPPPSTISRTTSLPSIPRPQFHPW